ncbi:hypothetical protein Tco_1029551 [Tanacetum coccineum]|uniref:Uncharacterized protein n=1 Tax=Tanacetum coccineum TaxID=301880 RepID=A0ABQ5G3Q7_9ASTR
MAILTIRIDDLIKGKSEKGKNKKEKSEKGLIAESFDCDEESISSEDEGTTKIRAFMSIAEDEPFVGKANARSGQWVDITMKKTCSKVTLNQLLSEKIPSNNVKALGGRESNCETQEPLPPLPKLIGAAPTGTLDSLISLSDLTLSMADLTLDTSVPKKTKPTFEELKGLKKQIAIPSGTTSSNS